MILITGGAGYIGSHTVLNLIEKNSDIYIYIVNKYIVINILLHLIEILKALINKLNYSHRGKIEYGKTKCFNIYNYSSI